MPAPNQPLHPTGAALRVPRTGRVACYHRSCPQCAELDRERWLATWKERLLECGHVHSIFTTPHDLIPLWRYNKRLFGNLLFPAAMSALSELLGDEKYLGAVAGMLAALHTWARLPIRTCT